jgi:putative hydrolase of the HAD superfamily
LFQASVDQFGVKPNDCLHVGDDPIRDIEAAANFGMKTAWMNRTKQMWPSLTKSADISVSNLEELIKLLPR